MVQRYSLLIDLENPRKPWYSGHSRNFAFNKFEGELFMLRYVSLLFLLNPTTLIASQTVSFVVNTGASVVLADALLNMTEPGLTFKNIAPSDTMTSASCRITFFHPNRADAAAKNSNNAISCNVTKSDGSSASILFSLAEVPMDWFGSAGRPPAVSFESDLADNFYMAFELSAKNDRIKDFAKFRRRFDYVDSMTQTEVQSWGVATGVNTYEPNQESEVFPLFLDCTKFVEASKVTKRFCAITALEN